jgi:hypothetical protein
MVSSQSEYVMADPPGMFDTLETWERYLSDLREKVPDSASNKPSLIAEAEREIARIKRTGS